MNTPSHTHLVLHILIVLLMMLPTSLQAADRHFTIYSKTEPGGALLLTDRHSRDVQVYMRFRQILRRMPQLSRQQILALAAKHSKAFNLDAKLVQAVIEVESGFKQRVVSSKGAEGLMQIMPETQKDLGVRNAFDPDENIKGGVKYLRMMLDRFETTELALAAYNAGPGNVERYKGIPPFEETQTYVRKVMARYSALSAS